MYFSIIIEHEGVESNKSDRGTFHRTHGIWTHLEWRSGVESVEQGMKWGEWKHTGRTERNVLVRWWRGLPGSWGVRWCGRQPLRCPHGVPILVFTVLCGVLTMGRRGPVTCFWEREYNKRDGTPFPRLGDKETVTCTLLTLWRQHFL